MPSRLNSCCFAVLNFWPVACWASIYLSCCSLACFCHSSRVSGADGNMISLLSSLGFRPWRNLRIVPRSVVVYPAIFISQLKAVMYESTSPLIMWRVSSLWWASSFLPVLVNASLNAFFRSFHCCSVEVVALNKMLLCWSTQSSMSLPLMKVRNRAEWQKGSVKTSLSALTSHHPSNFLRKD